MSRDPTVVDLLEGQQIDSSAAMMRPVASTGSTVDSSAAVPLRERDEDVQVRDAARSLLESEWPLARAAALAENPQELLRLWHLAVAQGWAALDLADPELGLAAALVLQQELGRAECPLPLADSLLADAVLGGCASSDAARLRRQLHNGGLVPTWCFGPYSGEAGSLELVHDAAGLSARMVFIENTSIATHLFIASGRDGEVLIVPLEQAIVRATPGFARPPLAEVVFQGVARFERIETTFDLQALVPLARLLLAARALGATQHGLALLSDYAKLRTQFGRAIGQFQAIQHKLADGLIGVEVCRLAQLHAGSCADPALRLHSAATAAALAGEYLRKVVLEIHHGFGGISFWEEHEMPRIFRRVHADVTRLGGVQAARAELAGRLLTAGARIPDIALGGAADAFRDEVRDWLRSNWDHEYPKETEGQPLNHRKAWQAFSRKLGALGWLAGSWPLAYGGQARSALEQMVYEEEIAYSDAPVIFHNAATTMIGPALIRFGSAQQKQAFLPGIARGDISFALGYSEPDHGSDLAGIRTAAVRTTDGRWRINGQKIFTSAAGFATHVWLAARTGSAPSRHRGISVFIVPLDTPGITIQPMRGINDHRSNVVFYDDVTVGADALVGAENAGWDAISAALAFERVSLAAIGARARGYFDLLLAHLQTRQAEASASLTHDRIGQLAAQIEAARLLAVNTANVVHDGEIPVCQAAMVKVYASELMERLSETVFDMVGTGATLRAGNASALLDGRFEYAARDALLYTIGGGTNEIQRSLIAQRGLGMPREPSRTAA